jgi:hypothetical protein
MNEIENKGHTRVDPVIRAKIFIWSLLLITPLALFVGFVSTGAGHGNYVLARIIFPYTFAYWHFSNNAIPSSLAILGFLQIPIYGGLLALPSSKYIMLLVGTVLATLHLAAVYLCFSHSYAVP